MPLLMHMNYDTSNGDRELHKYFAVNSYQLFIRRFFSKRIKIITMFNVLHR